MILSDILVANRIHHFSNTYDEQIWVNVESGIFQTVAEANDHSRIMNPKIKLQDITGCLERLETCGYVKISYVRGEMYFSVTPKLNHWLQFFLDTFSKKFLGGFFAGVVTTVIGGLLLAYIRAKWGI